MIDQEALNTFNQLYEATYSDVLKYVIVHCSCMEDVKDIIQNIYVDVLMRLDKDKVPISEAYMMGIAKNKVKDYYRFRYKHKMVSLFSNIKDQKEIALIETLASDMDIDKMILKEEDIEFIWQYLKSQKIVIFKIFYLYYVMDFSIKDISKELCISESNVKNYLYRTCHRLKILMKDRGDIDV